MMVLFPVILTITSISTKREEKDRKSRTRDMIRDLEFLFQMTNCSWKSELLDAGIITQIENKENGRNCYP